MMTDLWTVQQIKIYYHFWIVNVKLLGDGLT